MEETEKAFEDVHIKRAKAGLAEMGDTSEISECLKNEVYSILKDLANYEYDPEDSAKSRDSDNTVLKKAYPGGMLTITGSNSSASLASVPCRYVFGDERDRWARDVG